MQQNLISTDSNCCGDCPPIWQGCSNSSVSQCHIHILLFGHPTHFILIAGLLYIYIMHFRTCYNGYRP
jgi:hypothetical protein